MSFFALAAAAALQQPTIDDGAPPAEVCLRRPSPDEDDTTGRAASIKALKTRSLSVPIAYPAATFAPAEARSVFGVTVMDLELLPIGRIGDCRIVSPSGSTALDSQSCKVVRTHLILRPKMQGNQAVSSRFRIAFVWIPEDAKPGERGRCSDDGGTIPINKSGWFDARAFSAVSQPQVPRGTSPLGGSRVQGALYFELTVSETGTPIGCRILGSTLARSLDETACRLMAERAWVLPAVDERGNFRKAAVRGVVRLQLG